MWFGCSLEILWGQITQSQCRCSRYCGSVLPTFWFFLCVSNNLLAMHNCARRETAIILRTISARCLCLRSVNALFCLCLPEEQLEEDKLHSNGGKVLSSELKNNHSGCSPFRRCVSESVLCPSFQAASSVPACVLTHSASLLFCSGTCFSRSPLHPFMF